jgi:fatty-acyl-CoA synthase
LQTLNSAIAWWARNRAGVTAISLDGDRVSYRDYAAWIDRVAAWLIDLQVRPGDRVEICAANSLEYCALAMGAMRAGAIVAPLNARYTAHELAEIAADHAPALIVAGPEEMAKVAGLGFAVQPIAAVTALRHGPPAAVDVELDPDACVLIISTSGSTARPKGVMFSHRTMLSYVAGYALEESALAAGGGVINVAPLATSAGMVQLVHYTVMGCSLFMEPVFSPERFLRILVDEKIVGFGGVPTFFERIAAAPGFAEADLSNLKIATTGGSRVARALQDTWAAKGVIIRQIYGQTECGGNATLMPADRAAAMPEKCGRGGIFTELRIVDAEGNTLAPNTPGQILIRGPGTMLGYWNNPDATAEVLRDGWLHTGDIGVLDEDGLLTFVDRLKDLVISGGLNISAAEVERAVSEYPGVEEVAVIAAKDPRFGETPLAVVYGRAAIDVGLLIAHCNERLADFKVPRYVAFEAEPLPRLATQKISKPILRDKYKDAHETLERVR